MVSPIDVIAALLGQNPFNVKRKYGACCIGLAKTKLVGVRNSKEAGDAATIKRVLCACSDPRIKAICQKTWPAEIVPMDVAPEFSEEPRGEEIESAHTFVSEPNQMVDFVLKLADGSDFVVPVRRDGYVNVTKICQAAGKRSLLAASSASHLIFILRLIMQKNLWSFFKKRWIMNMLQM